MTTYSVKHAAELCGLDGPTGELVEVVLGTVEDEGGNVLFRGTADDCVEFSQRWRGSTRLIPSSWRRLDGPIAFGENEWCSAS